MAAVETNPSAAPVPAVHLRAACASVVGALLGLATLHAAVRREVVTRTERFNVFPQYDKLYGAAVQTQVLRDPSLLLVNGSSELTQGQGNRADGFFSRHPTGFGAFLIGNPGSTCLMMATRLASLTGARGRKVAVFLSPGWFFAPQLDPPGFGFNFSPLQTSIFAFESRLSAPLKQGLARRMLDYPATIGQFPLLDRALRDLADDNTVARADLALLAPMGALHGWTLRRSDEGKLAYWMWHDHPAAPPATPPVSPPIRWQERVDQADATYRQRPLQTSYSVGVRTGFDDALRRQFRDPRHLELSPDEQFARACLGSKEWGDLRLLLRVAQEAGIDLLLVCQPLNETFTRLQGLTARSNALFYDRLRETAAPFGVTLDTFPEAEADPYFYQDCDHPSAKAWVVYDQCLDRFFHAPTPASTR